MTKRQSQPPLSPVRQVLLGTAIVGSAVAVAVGMYALFAPPEFTTAKWRGTPAQASASCGDKDYRKPYVDGVVADELQAGMTRADVRRVLGPPDFTESESFPGVDGWYYEIGWSSSYIGPGDCVFLFAGFDGDGRLARWFDSRDPPSER